MWQLLQPLFALSPICLSSAVAEAPSHPTQSILPWGPFDQASGDHITSSAAAPLGHATCKPTQTPQAKQSNKSKHGSQRTHLHNNIRLPNGGAVQHSQSPDCCRQCVHPTCKTRRPGQTPSRTWSYLQWQYLDMIGVSFSNICLKSPLALARTKL
jgi:hypothetical protein